MTMNLIPLDLFSQPAFVSASLGLRLVHMTLADEDAHTLEPRDHAEPATVADRLVELCGASYRLPLSSQEATELIEEATRLGLWERSGERVTIPAWPRKVWPAKRGSPKRFEAIYSSRELAEASLPLRMAQRELAPPTGTLTLVWTERETAGAAVQRATASRCLALTATMAQETVEEAVRNGLWELGERSLQIPALPPSLQRER